MKYWKIIRDHGLVFSERRKTVLMRCYFTAPSHREGWGKSVKSLELKYLSERSKGGQGTEYSSCQAANSAVEKKTQPWWTQEPFLGSKSFRGFQFIKSQSPYNSLQGSTWPGLHYPKLVCFSPPHSPISATLAFLNTPGTFPPSSRCACWSICLECPSPSEPLGFASHLLHILS